MGGGRALAVLAKGRAAMSDARSQLGGDTHTHPGQVTSVTHPHPYGGKARGKSPLFDFAGYTSPLPVVKKVHRPHQSGLLRSKFSAVPLVWGCGLPATAWAALKMAFGAPPPAAHFFPNGGGGNNKPQAPLFLRGTMLLLALGVIR